MIRKKDKMLSKSLALKKMVPIIESSQEWWTMQNLAAL
jgi:hypothetical protein